MSIPLAPNDKSGFYIDCDQSVFEADDTRMVLYIFDRSEMPDLNSISSLSKIEIQIDRRNLCVNVKYIVKGDTLKEGTLECISIEDEVLDSKRMLCE